MRIAQRPAQQLDADSLLVRFGAAVALFNGGEIKRDVGGWRLLVIEILRDLLANAAGVVTDLCANLLIGLGVSIIYSRVEHNRARPDLLGITKHLNYNTNNLQQ